MNHSRSPSADQRRRIGKDEINLADWALSTSQFQQQRDQSGGLIDFAESVIKRPNGKHQVVRRMAPSRVGLPTAVDDLVLFELIAKSREFGLEHERCQFVPRQILQRLGWGDRQESYDRLEQALLRLRAITITFENAWYDKSESRVVPVLMTGILSEVRVERRKAQPVDSDSGSYFVLTPHFRKSLEQGNLINIDLEFLRSLKRPIARALYRHLNKRWFGGRRPNHYERDLHDLACGHFGMTDSKDLKRNFTQAVVELEQRGYLEKTLLNQRYAKVSKGVWRVHLDLSPEFNRDSSASPTGHNNSDAHRLVCQYFKQKGESGHQPTRRELLHAQRLLETSDLETLTRTTSKVLKAMKASRFDHAQHFGAVVSFYEKQIQEAAEHESKRAKKTLAESMKNEDDAVLRSRIVQKDEKCS